MFSLDHKIAVVTGGVSGIGKAITERLRLAGALVVVLDRQKSASDEYAIQTDISQETNVASALDEVKARYGRINILVNNAGIQPLGVGFGELTQALLERTFAVNVNGVAFGIKHAARLLERGGRVINLASFVGVLGTPRAAAYGTSKAAVIHLTRLGALELADRAITVNAISPGTIRTPAVTDIPNNPEMAFVEARTPLRRLGEPAEVAALCHFLVSDEAGYITGQNICIDGGITAGWMDYDVLPPPNIHEGKWVDHV